MKPHGEGVTCPPVMHKAHVVSVWHRVCQLSAALSGLQCSTVAQYKGAKCLCSDYTGSKHWVERANRLKSQGLSPTPLSHVLQVPISILLPPFPECVLGQQICNAMLGVCSAGDHAQGFV